MSTDSLPQTPSATTTPLHLPSDQDASGRTFGWQELAFLRQVLDSGVLTSTKGQFVKQLESSFASMIGAKHVIACSSGTAAVHAAVAAIDPEPGDEIITTSITDMGALTPILYQGAIPVFADVDPHTYNVTAESIRAVISDRTRAIIVTHLFGNPCEMEPITQLAKSRGIPIIEDCAQAFLSSHQDQYVGTLGSIGCFSLQQGKHITTGEGGLVVTNDDDIARRLFLFINKAWGYGDEQPDHYFLALNYRMSELQGAVAAAQLGRLQSVVGSRIRSAIELSNKLDGIRGLATPFVSERIVHTYWKYCLNVDERVIRGGAPALGQLLKDRGIACAPRYIQKPAFECEIFRDQRTFGNSRFPFNLARPAAVDYSPEKFSGTYTALSHVLVLPWNERFEDRHVDFIADAIIDSVAELTK
ncbi:MAG: DegT/DnrJ/EryC1/StrS family aminotransferase [Planctomycetota bacterium]|nr:DegT/DnrJ/EryC1/StrS family aminotransferase [Planctomycetota bacterium]